MILQRNLFSWTEIADFYLGPQGPFHHSVPPVFPLYIHTCSSFLLLIFIFYMEFSGEICFPNEQLVQLSQVQLKATPFVACVFASLDRDQPERRNRAKHPGKRLPFNRLCVTRISV